MDNPPAILAASAFFSLAGFALYGLAYDIQVNADKCFEARVQSRSLGYLSNILSFVFFMQYAHLRRKPTTPGDDKTGRNPKTVFAMGILFMGINLGSTGMMLDIYKQCAELRAPNGTEYHEGLHDVYISETVDTTISYAINDLIVIVAVMHVDLHLHFFVLMATVVAAELCQAWLNEDQLPGSFVFNYFHLKKAILVWEAGTNCHYIDLFHATNADGKYGSNPNWRQFNAWAFVLYMLANGGKQVYYNQPAHDRWTPEPEGHEKFWRALFWTSSTLEIVMSLYLLGQAIYWRQKVYNTAEWFSGFFDIRDAQYGTIQDDVDTQPTGLLQRWIAPLS